VRALVHGLAITGTSTVIALQRHGYEVVATDDVVDDDKLDRASELGMSLTTLPDSLSGFVAGFDLLSPAPGVPERHPVIVAALASGVPVHSEIELAYRWEQDRPGGPRPILAVTGTDGKTTTTDLTVAILRAAGVRTAALGNTDVPLVDAIDTDLDVLVVECTSEPPRSGPRTTSHVWCRWCRLPPRR
jgi:UDP-N-acetylmuramoylalanine--D-glutamate ligase